MWAFCLVHFITRCWWLIWNTWKRRSNVRIVMNRFNLTKLKFGVTLEIWSKWSCQSVYIFPFCMKTQIKFPELEWKSLKRTKYWRTHTFLWFLRCRKHFELRQSVTLRKSASKQQGRSDYELKIFKLIINKKRLKRWKNFSSGHQTYLKIFYCIYHKLNVLILF